MAKQACANFGGVEIGEIEEVWHAMAPPYGDLSRGSGRSNAPRPTRRGVSAVMLAQPIDEAVDFAKLDPADYIAEWKWDGIRVQAVMERGQRLYTRTGDDISAAFPDVVEALDFRARSTASCWFSGIAPWLQFGDLQQRLNRKTVDAKQLASFPAGIRAYDLMLDGDRTCAACPSSSVAPGWKRSSGG
ncbi:hypothetical protein ACRAWD_07885 [Caulobacter segnis]